MKQIRTLIVGMMFLLATPVLSSAGWTDAARTGNAASPRHATVFEGGHRERDTHREVARHDRHREVREVKRHHDERWHRDYAGRYGRHDVRHHAAPRVVYRPVPARPAPVRTPVLVAPLIPLPLPNSLVLHFSF